MRCMIPLALLLVAGTAQAALPWPFDMRIVRVSVSREVIRVVTTGAEFAFHVKTGSVDLHQRLNAKRPVGALLLGEAALHGLVVASQDQEQVKLGTAAGLALTVTNDSVLRLDLPAAGAFELRGDFKPEYLHAERYGMLALDASGGMSAFPIPRLAARPLVEASSKGFDWRQDLPAQSTLLVGICPPREYNWQQHAEERIVHQFPRELAPGLSDRPLPTDDELVQWRKFANVLVLHLEFWDGFGVKHIKPKDPARFREVVDLAHRLGFLVLPYSSTYYYTPATAPGGKLKPDAAALYMEEAKWLLEEYQVDGLYWDGEFMDVLQAWESIRQARKLLGARRLYVHCTTMPFPSTHLYCPFINTWADYLLRGEGQRGGVVDPVYLRYVVSGYNISNAIGELCYDNCRVDQRMCDWALQANARIPYWPGLQTHSGVNYFLSPEEKQLFKRYYVPAANRVKSARDYAPLAAEGLRARQARAEELARQEVADRETLAKYVAERKQTVPPRDAANLAAYASGICSDYCRRREGPHGLGYPPAYATDQNPDTYFAIDGLPQWYAVDLGQAQSISRVWLQTYFGDKRTYHYRIEVSADGAAWSQVAEKMDDALSTEAGDTYSFAPIAARYVRVTILHNSANDAGHICEIGVYR